MFIGGFEKVASGDLVGVGMHVGALGGALLAYTQSKKFIEDHFLKDMEAKKDARELFGGMKSSLPKNTVLLTNTDLHAKVKSAKSLEDMQFWKLLRDGTEGNAGAIPESATKGGVMQRLREKLPGVPKFPEELKGKNIIISDDKVHPAVLAHEAGHIIDFDETARGGTSKKVKNFFSLPFRDERAAWRNAPTGGIDKEVMDTARKGALGTYYRGAAYPLLGAALGGLIAHKMGNR